VLASRGKVSAAHEQFRLGVTAAIQNGFTEVAGQLQVEDGEMHAMAGECDEARSELASAFKLTRDNYSLERGGRALMLCGDLQGGGEVLRELRDRYPNATLTQRVSVPIAQATAALRRNDGRQAVELLEPVKPYDRTSRSAFWSEYLRGQAYLRLKQPDDAIAEFQRILDHHGEDPPSSVFPLVRLELARAHAMKGDTGNARQAYQAFLSGWSGADPDLMPLVQARQELARLR
jgi:tetratricopeptide (TPR) repeat protein